MTESQIIWDEQTMQVRRDLMAANLELVDMVAVSEMRLLESQAETARVTALFESCVPPPAEKWLEGTPYPLQSADFRAGWDSCRQKMIDLLMRRP